MSRMSRSFQPGRYVSDCESKQQRGGKLDAVVLMELQFRQQVAQRNA